MRIRWNTTSIKDSSTLNTILNTYNMLQNSMYLAFPTASALKCSIPAVYQAESRDLHWNLKLIGPTSEEYTSPVQYLKVQCKLENIKKSTMKSCEK